VKISQPSSALALAERRAWPVFPVNPRTKAPLVEYGRNDATHDAETISAWWRRWPGALVAIPTGPETGIVVLDVDVTDKESGWDSLEELGIASAPETPMSHTPRGGTHCYFQHPGVGVYVKTIAGKLGRLLDIRGDGGSITLPSGTDRWWDPHYGPATPLARMPEWMIIPEPAQPETAETRPSSSIRLTRYGEAALDNAVRRIVNAPRGAQETTLNTEVYGIGRLAGGGVIPPDIALDALQWAASKMPTYDGHRPWRHGDLTKKIKIAFADGLAQPREAPR